MADVLIEQAKEEFQLKNYSRFESLLLRAHKPEMIISLYKVRQYFIQPVTNFTTWEGSILGP